MAEGRASWRRSAGRIFNYANNAITITGIVLTTVSALAIITFTITELMGGIRNPYVGIFSFMVLPGVFVVGLVLIPLGMWRRRRALIASGVTGEELDHYPKLDFNSPAMRRVGLIVLALTAINAVIIGVASYYAVDVMDTAAFCGETCHHLMQPEFTAYHQSEHSRVACVECHIGPGAPWFVRSKIDGLRQVWKTVFDTYHRPIETPIHNLRPARQTCEACHWPAKHHGDKLWAFARFAEDEHNTPSYNVMLIKTGGGTLDVGGASGIHWWHIFSDNRIRYLADPTRQKISWVELTTPSGEVRRYMRSGEKAPGEEAIRTDARLMDCIDCHNRPTHLFQVPGKALDDVLLRFPELRELPYYKKTSLEAIEGDYPTHKAGVETVRTAVISFYQQKYPEMWSGNEQEIRHAADEAALVYDRSVFPEMKTNWETHPNNLGHDDFPGCWRCHDDEMSTPDGKHTIPQDCETCHVFLVEDSPTQPDLSKLELPSTASTE